MNSTVLDFTPRISDVEREFTRASLKETLDKIRSTIDIRELAGRLGIKMDVLPKDAPERENYIWNKNEEVHMADCPYCHQKGTLRLFGGWQTFGCHGCNWDGENSNYMDIFFFLDHCNAIKIVPSWDNGEDNVNRLKLMKLFELFPLELRWLTKTDIFTYHYYGAYSPEEADARYYPGIEKDYEDLSREIRGGESKHLGYNYLEPLRQRRSRLNDIIESHKIAAKIYAHQETVNGILIGKSLEEVLGYPIVDEYHEGNTELQVLISENYGDSEAMENSVIQTLEAESRREAAEKQAQKDAETARLEAIRLAEEQRLQELARAKQENVKTLYVEILESSNKQQEFFASCSYNTILEGDVPLAESDFGKFVVVFDKGTSTFSVVIGKQKVQSVPPPKSISDANTITRTDKMPKESGLFHENIQIPEGSKRFGGAQYIVLPNNTVLIGGYSGKYDCICREIAEKCLLEKGYTTYFLNNIGSQSLENVFNEISKK